jgi:hypothetical protein
LFHGKYRACLCNLIAQFENIVLLIALTLVSGARQDLSGMGLLLRKAEMGYGKCSTRLIIPGAWMNEVRGILISWMQEFDRLLYHNPSYSGSSVLISAKISSNGRKYVCVLILIILEILFRE